MHYRRTFYFVGFVFSAILFTTILGIMSHIIVSGGLEMEFVSLANIPLLLGSTEVRKTYRRRACHAFGDTIASFDGNVRMDTPWEETDNVKIDPSELEANGVYEVWLFVLDSCDMKWIYIKDKRC